MLFLGIMLWTLALLPLLGPLLKLLEWRDRRRHRKLFGMDKPID